MQPSKSTCLIPVLFLLVACAAIASASLNSELRCQCITTVSRPFPPRHIDTVEVIPSGAHCANVQVIATLKSGKQSCLNPEAKWVQKFIERILKSASRNI